MLLPAWVPSDSLALALAAFIILVLAMNRGRWWTLNALAQKEPAAIAVGLFIVLATVEGWFSSFVPVLSTDTWVVIGVITAGVGVIAYYTDMLDL